MLNSFNAQTRIIKSIVDTLTRPTEAGAMAASLSGWRLRLRYFC